MAEVASTTVDHCGAAASTTSTTKLLDATVSSRPKVVFVLGGPGAGKGTQCEKITYEFGYKHISAGDCLREERQRPGSKFGELIEGHIVAGTIVPVEITCALLRQKMEQLGWENGRFLIDGFPRNEDNLGGWKAACGADVDVPFCLFLDCPEEVMMRRLVKRGETSGRSDDNADTIKKRLDTFNKESKPIVDQFFAEGRCRRVVADRSIDEVFKDIKKAFAELN